MQFYTIQVQQHESKKVQGASSPQLEHATRSDAAGELLAKKRRIASPEALRNSQDPYAALLLLEGLAEYQRAGGCTGAEYLRRVGVMWSWAVAQLPHCARIAMKALDVMKK